MITKESIVYKPGDSLFGFGPKDDEVAVVEYEVQEIIQDKKGPDFPIFINLLRTDEAQVVQSVWVQEIVELPASPGLITSAAGRLFALEFDATTWRNSSFRPAP